MRRLQSVAPLLRLAGVGLGLSAVAGVLRGWQLHRLFATDPGADNASVTQMLQLVSGLDLLTLLMITLGVVGAAPRLGRRGLPILIGWSALALFRLLWLMLAIIPESEAFFAFLQAIPWPIHLTASMVFELGAVILLWQHLTPSERSTRAVAGLAGCAVVAMGLWTIGARLELMTFEATTANALSTGLGCLVNGLLAVVFFALASRNGREAARATGGNAPAAAGLRLFRGALLARVVALVIIAVFTVFAGMTRSVGLAKLMLYGGTGLNIALGCLMVGGLWRYAMGVRAGATAGMVAAAALGGSLLVEGWTLALLADLFAGRVDAARASLAWAQALGQGLGIIGMLALLASLKSAARALDEDLLAQTAARLSVLVGVLFVSALALRGLATARGVAVALGLVASGIVLILAVVVLTKLLDLVRRIGEALDVADSASRDAFV